MHFVLKIYLANNFIHETDKRTAKITYITDV